MKINYDKIDWTKINEWLVKYLWIMKWIKNLNVFENEDFRRKFKWYYRIMRKSEEFYNIYFKYFEDNKNKKVTFEQTLKFFFDKLDRIESSFSSKIVATINPNFPILDSQVLKNLWIKIPVYNLEKKERFNIMIKNYNKIIIEYSDFLKNKEWEEAIKIFDENIWKVNITDIKKIDFMLWQSR